jgi:hypothetical protein
LCHDAAADVTACAVRGADANALRTAEAAVAATHLAATQVRIRIQLLRCAAQHKQGPCSESAGTLAPAMSNPSCDGAGPHGQATVLAEPTLTTINGRAASFSTACGVSGSGISRSGQSGRCRTCLDVLPNLLDDETVRLEFRLEHEESGAHRSTEQEVARHTIDTAVRVRLGEPLVLASETSRENGLLVTIRVDRLERTLQTAAPGPQRETAARPLPDPRK